ncbi:MAG: VOC family protein [Alphaproteobacteria bacterium]
MKLNALAPLLNVEDAARSIRFYTQTLGFDVVREAEIAGAIRWAALRHGDITLMINQSVRADSGRRRKRPSYGETVFYFYVESAPALQSTLKGRGVEVGEVTVEDYGLAEFRLRDPDGYELAFGSEVDAG